MAIFRALDRSIHALETSKAPFYYFLLTFFFAVTLRNFLELFSQRDIHFVRFVGMDLSSIMLHFYFSYIALALSFILLFKFIVGTSLLQTAKVVLPCFIILISVPLLDLLISGGKGYDISYLAPEGHTDLLERFIFFFGDYPERGASPGMRIEIAAVLVASSRLIFIKTSSLAKSLFGAFLVYSLVFTYGISPFIIKALVESLGYSYFPTPLFFQDFFVAFSFVLLAIVAIVLDRERISAQKSPSLELRKLISCSSLFYFLLFALGLLYAAETTAQAFNPLQANIAYSAQGFFKLLIVLCALIWGVLFCSQASSSSEMDNLSLASLALCLTASALCSFQVFFFLSLLVGCSYLAYLSPLNLNRISLLAALLFGFQALVLVLLGYTTVSGFLQLSAQELGILLGVTLIAIPVLTLLRVVWRQRKITNSNEAKSV